MAKVVNNTLRTPEDLDARVNAYAETKGISKNRALLDLIEMGLNGASQPAQAVTASPDLTTVLAQLTAMQATITQHETRLTAMESNRLQSEVKEVPVDEWVVISRNWEADIMECLSVEQEKAIGFLYDQSYKSGSMSAFASYDGIRAITTGTSEVDYIETAQHCVYPTRWKYHAGTERWFIYSFKPVAKEQAKWVPSADVSDDPYARKTTTKHQEDESTY